MVQYNILCSAAIAANRIEMYIKLLIKSLLMTKEKYYNFVEGAKAECINDVRSFIYKDTLPSLQITADMFCMQPFHTKIESLYN